MLLGLLIWSYYFGSLTAVIILINRKMSELYQSRSKKAAGTPSSAEEYNRSTAKRLFSSVFSIIDNDQEISHFQQLQQSSRLERLLENPTFLSHLHSKMRDEGLFQTYKFPILSLFLEDKQSQNRFNPSQPKLSGGRPMAMQLEEGDVRKMASKFGQLGKVVLTADKRTAYLFFNSMANAYICLKLISSLRVKMNNFQLAIEWVHHKGYHEEVAQCINEFIGAINWESLCAGAQRQDKAETGEQSGYGGKQNKFTCRYDIQIDNQREFQVARRIIGPKGCNMKRIIEQSVVPEPKGSNDNVNELLKLRLRGKGSGYKEGPEQQQSTQNLHLCVSAKDENVYNQACQRVEKLLSLIYLDYSDFMKRQGRAVELGIRKIVLGQSSGFGQEPQAYGLQSGFSNSRNDFQQIQQGEETYRISPQKIAELLELRNKARRELNFGEADRIRNYLRSVGVCLIDEKGRRGKAAQVTTWKYIY